MLKMISIAAAITLLATNAFQVSSKTALADLPIIKLEAPRTTIPKLAPVVLRISLTNTTQHDVVIWALPGGREAERFYDVIGKDARGRELIRTAYGKSLRSGPIVMLTRSQETIKPDQSYAEAMEVSKIFKLSKPGLYSFQVEREYLNNERVDIKSNIVTVEIK